MKKSIIIILGIILIGGLATIAYLFKKPQAENVPQTASVLPSTKATTTCYKYTQAPTKDAPYRVNEKITLTIGNGVVTGTKSGFQSGPDMTNGYEGMLTGTKEGDTITAIFAYTVEGSTNNEQEEYQFRNQALVKHRYPLVEKNGILVPNKTGTPKDLVYNPVSCTE